MVKIIECINKKAAEQTRPDRAEAQGTEFNPQDWSGGNFDDAYSMGTEDGAIEFARELQELTTSTEPVIVQGADGDYFIQIGSGQWQIGKDGMVGVDEQSRASFVDLLASLVQKNQSAPPRT